MSGLIGHRGLMLAGGRWSPAQLAPPPKMWLDDTTSVTNVSGSASAWGSKGAITGSFIQGTSGFRPQILEGEINGRRALRFDGANDRMDSDDFSAVFQDVGFGSTLVVYKKRGSDVSATQRSLLRFQTGASLMYGVRLLIQASGPDLPNQTHMGARRLDTDSFSGISGAQSSGVWSILYSQIDWSSGVARIFQNGEEEGAGVITSPGLTENAPAAYTTTLGASRGGPSIWDRFVDADIAAVLVFSGTALTNADRQKLEGWAAWRYGLQGNLPPSHPYKNSPP